MFSSWFSSFSSLFSSFSSLACFNSSHEASNRYFGLVTPSAPNPTNPLLRIHKNHNPPRLGPGPLGPGPALTGGSLEPKVGSKSTLPGVRGRGVGNTPIPVQKATLGYRGWWEQYQFRSRKPHFLVYRGGFSCSLQRNFNTCVASALLVKFRVLCLLRVVLHILCFYVPVVLRFPKLSRLMCVCVCVCVCVCAFSSRQGANKHNTKEHSCKLPRY